MSPRRIQLSRRKGWRKPEGVVVVSRPSRWGNPCRVRGAVDREYAAAAFNNWLAGCKIAADIYGPPPSIADIRRELAGKPLGCWCRLTDPCHADALLHIANTDDDERARNLLAAWRVFPTFPAGMIG